MRNDHLLRRAQQLIDSQQQQFAKAGSQTFPRQRQKLVEPDEPELAEQIERFSREAEKFQVQSFEFQVQNWPSFQIQL